MGKLLGKLSTYCEAVEHGRQGDDTVLRGEVVPDLQVYAYQLANLLDVDAKRQYLNRLKSLAQKFDKP